MAQKTKVKVEKETSERWLLTYADLMNLLLIFFIILYSMSQVDSAKFKELSGSFKAAFGSYPVSGSVLPNGGAGTSLIPETPFETTEPTSTPIPEKKDGTGKTEADSIKEVSDKVASLIGEKNLQGSLHVGMEERGVVISITANFLFKSGSSDLEKDSLPLLLEIGKILQAVPGNHIRIEGHTDSDPINTPYFPSNWELSSSRATNVLRLLVDKASINPSIISAVGYGEYRPKVPNNSEVNKAQNRRVDIVIIKSIYDKSEAGKQ